MCEYLSEHLRMTDSGILPELLLSRSTDPGYINTTKYYYNILTVS